mmetsp:Transcript_18174/g.23437  ORF Transcript_18174/g.23437 Transcript_18174/m.23437 type:complete len:163 (-) Transcript_18174:124-612(-)|eukprot:CAMPEP_0198144850 /NCGR_PEP_ID=MMETSP1443-20131203/18862_1 /TAXON_ID=186043 /ORGANISM="Entomoneis sp., Strain CCMP2396" /LENGTH=162 /DNA_ID=CAMNT_0043808325 /DNA_START=55 /DNA_END=543 /DNA_ORIENTATION=-
MWFTFSNIANAAIVVMTLSSSSVAGLSTQQPPPSQHQQHQHQQSRRNFMAKSLAAATMPLMFPKEPALAAGDCYTDCYSNCRKIVPKDPTNYCAETCRDYCAQEDRQDGLSGSVSSKNGETGILGGTFGQGTVVKGQDKPPSVALPGLDFSSSKGRGLLGYN